jgi:hypothetical protein
VLHHFGFSYGLIQAAVGLSGDREKIRLTDAYKTATHIAANRGKPAVAIIQDELPDW